MSITRPGLNHNYNIVTSVSISDCMSCILAHTFGLGGGRAGRPKKAKKLHYYCYHHIVQFDFKHQHINITYCLNRLRPDWGKGAGLWAVCSFCPSIPSSYFPHMMISTGRSSHFAVDFPYKVDHSILLRVGVFGFILIRLIWYNSVLIHSPHNDTPLSLSPHWSLVSAPLTFKMLTSIDKTRLIST